MSPAIDSTIDQLLPSTSSSAPIHALPNKSSTRTQRNRLIALLLVMAAIAVVSAVAYHWSRPAGPAFRTVRVVRADITQRVAATGTLQPVVTSPVGAQVSGIVWKLHADYNSLVKEGESLVELDPSLFHNAVSLAAAQFASAVANLASAQATAVGARIVRDRTLRLERQSLVASADLDASEATFGQTTGLMRSSAAQISLARAQLDRARLDLEHSVIRSPVDGMVISRNIDVGQAVAATLTAPTLFTIAQDLHHMQVHAAVDEADIGEVRGDQTATFTVDAFRDETFRAVVREVRNAPQTAQSVVTYDVVLDTDNLEGKLRPGMTANVLILVVQKTQVLAVPNEALRFRPVAPAGSMKPTTAEGRSGAAVYVPRGASAASVSIHVGASDGTMTEVEGLEPGREVIIDVIRDKGKATKPGGPARGI